jgi:3-oxoacyl-[acyl-carrier protein] reductase
LVAVVTGAGRGIGREHAVLLAAEGAKVVVNDLGGAGDGTGAASPVADEVVREIAEAGGEAVASGHNVAEADGAAGIVAAGLDAFGKIDILVNNAGVYRFEPLEAVTEDEFHRQFNTNVLGLILATQEAAKYFGPEGGSVINVSSLASSATPPMTVVYSATKGAVDAITGVLANELGPKGIRVNAINPGPVATEGFDAGGFAGSDFEKQTTARTPLGRIGQPEDIAPAAVFFASDDSKWITGETLRIAGGLR